VSALIAVLRGMWVLGASLLLVSMLFCCWFVVGQYSTWLALVAAAACTAWWLRDVSRAMQEMSE
jgi:hypothetical protein